jgi:hypothetical protein
VFFVLGVSAVYQLKEGVVVLPCTRQETVLVYEGQDPALALEQVQAVLVTSREIHSVDLLSKY